MVDAVLYTSLDAGGPGPRMGMTDSSHNGVVGFYNLLVPCLVTGYGSGPDAKPGQGWQLVHEDLPLGFKLLAPDGVYYIFCQPASGLRYNYSPVVQVYMAEALSDLTAYPPVGTNVRSGHHSDTTAHPNRHWISPRARYDYNPSLWALVARGSQVFFSMSYYDLNSSSGNSAGETFSSSSISGLQLWFGNIIFWDERVPKSGVQNSCIIGGLSNIVDTWDDRGYVVGSMSLHGGFSRLRSPLTGLVEQGTLGSSHARCTNMTQNAESRLAVSAYPPDFYLERTHYVESGVGFVGYAPGQFYSSYYSHRRMGSLLQSLERSTSLSEVLVPLEIEGEDFYMIPTAYGTVFVSLMGKYWDA